MRVTRQLIRREVNMVQYFCFKRMGKMGKQYGSVTFVVLIPTNSYMQPRPAKKYEVERVKSEVAK